MAEKRERPRWAEVTQWPKNGSGPLGLRPLNDRDLERWERGAEKGILSVVVLDGELAVPCTRNPP